MCEESFVFAVREYYVIVLKSICLSNAKSTSSRNERLQRLLPALFVLQNDRSAPRRQRRAFTIPPVLFEALFHFPRRRFEFTPRLSQLFVRELFLVRILLRCFNFFDVFR